MSEYNSKRDFSISKEPIGKTESGRKNLRFVVQHHMARKEHYDLRLEYDGVMLSWAVPKGPSYNTKDKRLAVHVEDHPLSYRNFEGVIPKGEYGAGTVMIWDRGTMRMNEDFSKTYKKGYLKFELKGKRLKGKWTLIKFKEKNWLLIKENDDIKGFTNIEKLKTSVKTGRTMEEIANDDKKKNAIATPNIELTSPDKIIYKKSKTFKKEIFDYYRKVSKVMLPYLKGRFLSTVRTPNGTEEGIFFKKHFSENAHLKKVLLKEKGQKEDYYTVSDELGILSEVQMNSLEFHISANTVDDIRHPNMLVFDLDPAEDVGLEDLRNGVRELKRTLDDLNLVSYLKTSGGKGYHIVVPMGTKMTWRKFSTLANKIAKLMEEKFPERFTTNIRKSARKGKIFIDWLRNTEGASCVAPYSLRAREYPTISFPIKWSDLNKIAPQDIDIKNFSKYLRRKDPWSTFF